MFILTGVVKPDDVVAFYPTRYNIQQVAANIVCPVAVFFAENDVLPGATPTDACALREGLLKNKEVMTRGESTHCVCRFSGIGPLGRVSTNAQISQ